MKTIKSFKYRNGGFGVNHGYLAEVEGGFNVQCGNGGDPFFFKDRAQAEMLYHSAVKDHEMKPDFSQTAA